MVSIKCWLLFDFSRRVVQQAQGSSLLLHSSLLCFLFRCSLPLFWMGKQCGGWEEVDEQLWQACAGNSAKVPEVGARVVYFPQGHTELVDTWPLPPTLDSSLLPPLVLCCVTAVTLLADPHTDEVFARICLQPLVDKDLDSDSDEECESSIPTMPPFFAKTLTQSDANNGGGFSVPRYCAETIFPPLDYSADPPVQNIVASDAHGAVWKFRHIYRGTPRRHLLTTGWSNFVNQKKLVAGDSIVFLRSSRSADLCIGIRRSGKASTTWHHHHHHHQQQPLRGLSRPFLASAKLPLPSVLESTMKAASGNPFEIAYHPRSSIFAAFANVCSVKSALRINWIPGTRFKMAVDTEDSARTSWFLGTVVDVQDVDPLRWPHSPWKMLQVLWDEPDLLPGISRVSPWQVEVVSTVQMVLPFSAPRKKFRMLQPPNLAAATAMNPWQGFAAHSFPFPAGMQGARHDLVYGILSQKLQTGSPALLLADSSCCGNVSTELKMSNLPHQGSDRTTSAINSFNSSFSSGSSTKSSNTIVTTATNNTTPFLLFGKTIDTSESRNQNPHLFKEEIEFLEKKTMIADESVTPPLCKVFGENKEVGKTLNLSLFNTYPEMGGRLAKMFRVNEAEIMNRIASINS